MKNVRLMGTTLCQNLLVTWAAVCSVSLSTRRLIFVLRMKNILSLFIIHPQCCLLDQRITEGGEDFINSSAEGLQQDLSLKCSAWKGFVLVPSL